MSGSYGKTDLIKFLEYIDEKGLAKQNTARALKISVGKVLADLSAEEEADVRKVDVSLALRRFHNKNPNALSPKSLAEYERRVAKAIREFVRFREKPSGYVIGGSRPLRPDNGEKERGRAKQKAPEPTEPEKPAPVMQSGTGLTLAFPLRTDFLAQVVVPRDLRGEEAKRLAAFIATLVIE